MRQISNDFVACAKTHSLRAFAPLGIFAKMLTGVVGNSGRACFSILALLFASFTLCNVTSALSISVPQSISFDIVSGKASHSESATIEILSSDALAGYTLTLSGSDTLDASVSANGSLNATTKSNISDENEFDSNTWGLKYCNLSDNSNCINSTNYTQPSETLQIDKTAVNNLQPVKYALAIGAKTSNDIKADIYSNTFTLASVANPVYHSVGFVDWTENMPDAIAGTGTSITIPSNVPTKPGYTFAGWCPTKPINGVCTQTLIPAGTTDYSLATTDGVAYTNLYAIWDYADTCEGFIVMQNIANWKNGLDIGDIVTACDNRDHKLYSVGKLADGKVWLLDNLALERTTNDLSSTNTNVPDTWEGFPDGSYKLPSSTSAGFGSYTAAMINSEHKYEYADSAARGNIRADPLGDVAKDWKFGVYYNYCAASAGTYCMEKLEGSGNAEWDICPKGWKLPTGGAGGDFQVLYSAMGGPEAEYNNGSYVAYAEFRKALRLPYPGVLYDSVIEGGGYYAVVWSSTRHSSMSMHVLYVPSSINPQHEADRDRGRSIRCIAK